MASTTSQMSFPARMQILGDSGAGKTSVIYSYFKNQLYDGGPTFGYETYSKLISYNIDSHSFNVELIFWDSAGQTMNRRLTKNHYNCCYAVVFLYDVTNRQSFENLHDWITEFKEREKKCDNTVMWLIGNKLDEADLSEDSRQVTQLEAKELCDSEGLGGYTEISAHYSSVKIAKVFDMLIKEVVSKNYEELVETFKRDNLEKIEGQKPFCNQF